MKQQHMKQGRPLQTNGLRKKILTSLQTHQATPALLSHELQASKGAISSALARLKKAGEIEYHHGLYSVPAYAYRNYADDLILIEALKSLLTRTRHMRLVPVRFDDTLTAEYVLPSIATKQLQQMDGPTLESK